MFRNKKEDAQEELDVMNTTEETNQNNIPAQPRAAGAGAPQTPAGYRPAQGGGVARPAGNASAPRPAGASSNAMDARTNIATSAKSGSKRILTVGNDILLKGEIATCDRLVIEGMVDATLKDVHTVEISETGSFKGTAEIQDAEISGLFEGDLVVRNRLTIYATGRVRGTISYGEIEIERGGQMTGNIRLEGEPDMSKKKDAA